MTSDGTRRPAGDATLGSAPHDLKDNPANEESSNVQAWDCGGEAVHQPHFAHLEFDPDEFMNYVNDRSLSEAEAAALLRAIWDLVVSFVDLGFGLSPVQQALVDRSRRDDDKTFRPDSGVLSSKDKFTEIANMKPDGRTNRVPAAPEES